MAVGGRYRDADGNNEKDLLDGSEARKIRREDMRLVLYFIIGGIKEPPVIFPVPVKELYKNSMAGEIGLPQAHMADWDAEDVCLCLVWLELWSKMDFKGVPGKPSFGKSRRRAKGRER